MNVYCFSVNVYYFSVNVYCFSVDVYCFSVNAYCFSVNAYCFSVGVRAAGGDGDQPGRVAGCGHGARHAEGLLQPPAAVPHRARGRHSGGRRSAAPHPAREFSSTAAQAVLCSVVKFVFPLLPLWKMLMRRQQKVIAIGRCTANDIR